MTYEYTEDYSKGDKLKCYCNSCQREMNQIVLKSIREEYSDRSSGADGSSDYQIIQCNGCDNITYHTDCFFSEYHDFDNNGRWQEQYPKSTKNQHTIYRFEDLPYNLEKIYKEAIESYNSKHYVLCAAGIRAILEGICINKNILYGTETISKKDGSVSNRKIKTLYGKIKGLNQAGFITIKQEEALHELRFLGNYSLHEIEVPGQKDLHVAIEIIEHIIIDIYDIPYKSSILTTSRKKKRS